MAEVKGSQKRIRQSDCFHQEDANSEPAIPDGAKDEFSAKKPRDDQSSTNSSDINVAIVEDSMQSGKSNEDDYDDDDYDDIDDVADDHGNMSDNDDFLEDFEDDQSVASSASSNVSKGSSVCSNTPSLVGENLESFSLGESEKTGGNNSSNQKSNPGAINTPMVKTSAPPLRRSLFSNVPPTINFVHHNEVTEVSLPAELRKLLRWKLSNITPAVVKRVVTNSGFRLMRKTCTEWGGTWGKHMKADLFKELHEGQKINHLPGTFNIGRKDRLWKNYHKLRIRFGKEEFSFLPRTFCLPGDTKLLKKVWEKRGCRAKWIVKPPALARGTGISVVNKWSQIPKTRPLIVQKYVAQPHLINDTKYDLRIYILMTSLHPLRIYLYDEGLVRFASNTYRSDSKSLSDVFTHLTNYSINKNSSSYCPNEDSEQRQGHKWTLSSLWQHFAEQGIDNKPVIDAIKDLAIKTIVSAEESMHKLYRQNMVSNYCGYELFGFDVLLDAKLKPWLIEVNISPSLHSSSPLDLDVKSPLATEVFNLVRYHVPPAKMSAKSQREILDKFNLSEMTSSLCMDKRLYSRELSKAERSKQDKFNVISKSRDEYLESIIETLTPDDIRCLIRAEDELVHATHFSRIFPTQDTHKYFKFFEEPRYYNFLLDAWETRYGEQRAAAIDRLEQLCLEKQHLKMPSITTNPNNKAKKKNLDISQLKAPTPSVEIAIEDAQQIESVEATKTKIDAAGDYATKTKLVEQTCSVSGQSERVGSPLITPERLPIKAGKLSVMVKPHGVKTSFAPLGSGRLVSSSRKSTSNSPEPMSIGGDSEKSRSPSPILKDEENLIENDNRLISTSTTSSIAQVDHRQLISSDCPTNINDLNANANVNDNVSNNQGT